MQLVVGRVGRPHGIRGEVTVQVHTDDPDLRFAPGAVLATEPPSRGPLTVTAARWHSGRLLVAFEGCTDRNSAEDLRGTVLVVDADQASPAGPDEFHDHDLVGLQVTTRGGELLGVVTDVLHHGQDLLVVGPAQGQAAAAGRGDILVPFVAAIVPEVDVGAGRLVIDPPPGLLEL